jgi:hypothetical protein
MFPGPRLLRAFGAIALLLACAGLARGQAKSVPSTPIVADGLGKGSVPLDGPWQFHLGDNAAWANPEVDDASGRNGWEQIAADQPWGAQGHPGYTGIAWYRRSVVVTLAPGASPSLALYVPPVSDAHEVYWNGALVGRYGKLPPHPVWYYLPPSQTMSLGKASSGVLAVRVWKAPLTSNDSVLAGGFSSPPLIGSPEAIGSLKATSNFRWLSRNETLIILDGLYFMVGVIALVAWLRDRRQWLVFWTACMSISVVTVQFLELYRFPIPYVFSVDMAQPVFGLASVATWYVLALLLRLDESKTIRRILLVLAIIAMADCALDSLATWAIGFGSAGLAGFGQRADWFLTAIYNVVQLLPTPLVLCAVVRRKRLSVERWVVAFFGLLANLVPVFQSILSQGSRFAPVQGLADLLLRPLFTIDGAIVDAQAVTATLLLFAIVFAVYRYSQEDRRRQAAIEQEFKSARELQQVLIPEDLPAIPGYALTSAYKPAQEVGGDFFQVIPLQDDSTLVVLGDVSGKGLKAAMAVSLIVGTIRTLADFTSSPAEVLAGLNQRLHGRLHGGFATATALRLHPDGVCTLASAGHPGPFLNGRELSFPGALPLGLVAGTRYEETSFSLRKGDGLALFTDGLLEARNGSGELYGFARLQGLFAGKPTAAEATEAAVNFGQDDDITVLVLTRLGAGEESTAQYTAPILSPA